MSTQELDNNSKNRVEATKVLNEVIDRAQKTYKVAQKQADIVHKEARKLAFYTLAKEECDKAHREAGKQAEKLRDAIIKEAQAVFTATWGLSEKNYAEAVNQAKKDFKEAQKQADIAHREARKLAVYKLHKTEADETHKAAIEQAEKDFKETVTKLTSAEKSLDR